MDELELILTDIFNCSRANLYLNAHSMTFKDKEFKALEKILKDRGRTKPIQYILGHTEFLGFRLNVKRGVLIPRQETEILAKVVIDEVSGKKGKSTILDIGTGSGCIAIALAKFSHNVDITATDVSKEAIDLAKENAKLLKVEEKIRFLKSDLFNHKFFKPSLEFDIIVSNPPYVPTSEIGIFDISVTNEPKIALDGGGDGLDFYRRISKEAGSFLKKEGLLFLELGQGQSKRMQELFFDGWAVEKFIKDYQGIERICIIKKK
ncbi:peptide chain release factor N(5)-glutamine methyltransferase [Candidatus Omnitrophota bacterium]